MANPIKKYGYVGCGRLAMKLLKTEILEKTLLRRTKVQCADVLALPPRLVISPSLVHFLPVADDGQDPDLSCRLTPGEALQA